MAIESLRDAVQAIGKRADIGDLTANADGAFELVVAGILPVYFQEAGETEIEVQIRIPELEGAFNSDMASALLQANLDTRHGRFAVEPGTNKVLFSGRVNVTSHDEDSLMRAIDNVIKEGASWNGSGLRSLREDAQSATGDERVMSETLLRV